MAGDINNVQNYPVAFLACFCIAILGSQIVVINNLTTLSDEINRLDLWMKHFNEELVLLSSTLTRDLSSAPVSTKTDILKRSKDVVRKSKNGQGRELQNQTSKFGTESAGNFTCNITDSEVLSAIARAKTEVCKKELADIVCQDQEGKLIPETIPRYCPLKGANKKGQYLGCFKDNSVARDVGNFVITLKDDNSPEKCVEICICGGYSCAALQFSRECWCGNFYGKYGPLPESACSLSCPGNRSQTCGGYNAIRVFSTGLLERRKFRDATLVRHTQEIMHLRPVRIAFALMVAGRAVRQVKRLIKAIYHPDHYIFIHVDKKAEYMYQELLTVEDVLPNVRLTRERFSVGWSGFSQMQAAYGMMKSLVEMKDWAWDYFINLSECAYPIKTTEELAKFLTKYQGANFIKSHEVESYNFMESQGLRYIFHECEGHLWRLGMKRKMPTGITYDGGSDWFGLHRSFCTYAVVANDSLITELLKWAKHAFAPLESFFHILLLNSEFCDTQIDINLHMINWVAKQGCSCYKRKVDFCGCSPKNMKPTEFEAVLHHSERPVFFARKLEAVVNQEIYNLLDMNLGKVHPENAKLNLYWQNFNSVYDKQSTSTEVTIAFGNSFVRRASERFEENTQQCGYIDLKLLETHVLFKEDKFNSYLVKHSLLLPDTKACTYESRFSKVNRFKIENTSASNGRLKTLAVGSDFDSKERIFRNYPGFFGPDTEVVLHHAWIYGPTRKVKFAWIDPMGKVETTHNIRIARTRLIQFHNPKMNGRLRPGVWTVEASIGRTLIAKVNFLVLPIDTHSKEIDEPFNDNTIDRLTSKFWTLHETCLVTMEDKACPELQACKDTMWSSASSDPKSDITALDRKPASGFGFGGPVYNSAFRTRIEKLDTGGR